MLFAFSVCLSSILSLCLSLSHLVSNLFPFLVFELYHSFCLSFSLSFSFTLIAACSLSLSLDSMTLFLSLSLSHLDSSLFPFLVFGLYDTVFLSLLSFPLSFPPLSISAISVASVSAVSVIWNIQTNVIDLQFVQNILFFLIGLKMVKKY